jgi:hypothetical protein
MKIRGTLLALGSLLLMGTLASAGTADQARAPEAAADLSFLTTAQTSPDCSAAKLPSFDPAPVQKTFPCGTCSQSVCVGKAIGAVCGASGTRIYKCQAVYGNLCSQESAWECLCWNGPLP